MNTLVKFRSFYDRKVRGTRVAKGAPLYAIRSNGLYFIWAYTDRAFAEQMLDKVTPGDANDRAANWRGSLEQLCPSDRSKF